MHSLINQSVLTNYSCRLQGSAGISSTLESKHLKGILLFVCLFLFRSCTDDKHICDCLFVVSTINLLPLTSIGDLGSWSKREVRGSVLASPQLWPQQHLSLYSGPAELHCHLGVWDRCQIPPLSSCDLHDLQCRKLHLRNWLVHRLKASR